MSEVVGDSGPVLQLSATDCAALLPELVLHAQTLHRQGEFERVEALKPLIRTLTYVRGQASLRRAAGPGFRSEFPARMSDPLVGPSDAEAEKWISTKEAAVRIGCSRQWVGSLVRRGELSGRRVGRSYMVRASAVAAWADGGGAA